MNHYRKMLKTEARRAAFWPKGCRVYILRDETDSTGRLAAEDYELGRILLRKPELARCRVVSREDYFGTAVFRVLEADHE